MNGFYKVIFKNYTLRQAIRAEIEEDIGFFVRNIPGILGFLIRFIAYKFLFGQLKSVPYIFPNVRFVYMNGIRLGKCVTINSYTYVYGKGGIEIGDNVLIAPNCAIVSGDHNFDIGCYINLQPSKSEKIVIENDCWIGANAVILGGVTIKEGSIIGAGAVVTHDTDPYSINMGVPARKKGMRNSVKDL